MKRFLFCLTILLTAAVSAHAGDKVYLKNGKMVEGEILSQTKYSLKIKVDGFPKTFYTDEVDRVEATSKVKKEPAVADTVADTDTVTEDALTDEKKAVILEFLKVTGTQESLRSSLLVGLAKVPAQERQRFEGYMKADEILDQLVPVYAKRFTMAELQELIVFYSSPTGKKFLANMPDIMQESIQAMLTYFQNIEKGESASSLEKTNPVGALP